ncbi:trimethylamine-N-oxide reductase TorA [Corticimicrobacter populi]|uniref:Trimethylamine-N-oxide reductase n=1 Tax=Corticimicrobacter populi TaxID=2175229 RepID=A0A2V1JVU1_9BURK|nr:trimethylamine-N-oxide reductase TorA [Corticimicrobacter populi]PWF21250.1 trimethylamine-N-oxide reductase TorA [Corticimicrobacter populi]
MKYSRRGFLKAMTLLSSSTLAAPGLLVAREMAQTVPPVPDMSDDFHSWKVTGSHFGAMRARVSGDRVQEIRPFEFDKHPTEMLKGMIGMIYSPSRVRYPMVRLDWYRKRHLSDTSQRGDNRFVRVSWDEALDLFYEELERIQQEYGPWALHTGGGGWRSVGQMHSCVNHMLRGIGMHGRAVATVGDYSTGAGQVILPYVLGSTEVYTQGTSWDVILNESKLIIFWANDPVKNLQVGWNTETHETYTYFEQLKQKIADKQIRVICMDPVKSKTQKYLDAEHQPVNPMTDVALMLAIAHTLVKESLYDEQFLETYTVGFERFLPYLEGKTEDMVEKTPEWAEAICGVPADRIRELARLMAGNRTQLIFGWAVQRQQHGEQPYWMGAVLAAMLGQIGLPGGGISYSHHYSSVGEPSSGAAMPGSFPLNLDPGQKPKYDNTDYKGYSSVLPIARVVDALLEPGSVIDFNGSKVTLPPYKMAIFSGCNQWHRHPQRNRMKEAWQKLETVVAIDYNWTATCRFADIVLPACTTFERNDLDAYGSYSNRGVIAMHKLIDPLFNSRSDFDIFRGLTRRFDREAEYTRGMNEMQWVESLYESCRQENNQKGFDMPPFADFWKTGYVLFPKGKPEVRHAGFRDDAEVNALGTPSGFIEIFSRKIDRYGYEDCKGHPVWMEKTERSHGGPGSDRYPLWMQSVHPDKRLHSQLCESEPLRATYAIQGREPVFISPQDAAARGIRHGDLVRVFNDRGQLLAGAHVSADFPSGVVRIQEGAWYGPTGPEIGALDTYGDPNTLTLDVGTSRLAQATSANTCLVEIERFTGPVPRVTSFGGPIEVDTQGREI